jgi:nucleoid-associated protein YgaU
VVQIGGKVMGLFDKMFGQGAAEVQHKPQAQQRFDALKNKYQTALIKADQLHIQFENLHVQEDNLFIKAIAPSEDAKNKFWDQIKLVNPNIDDIIADIRVDENRAQGASIGGGGAGETYTVRSGDTLSKISKHFYGDSNDYMRIFYANRDKLNDPDKLHEGIHLAIPGDEDFPD